ncbi:MAG: type II secretion system protein [Vicinamibacterales bacterium]
MKLRSAAGFALIDVLFTCALLGILSSIALPRFLLARQSASAATAIGALRYIHSAQLSFALTCGSGYYAPNLTTLGQVPPGGGNEAFISPALSEANTVTRSGYSIKIEASAYPGAPGSCNGLAPGQSTQAYSATANPIEPENRRYFGTNVNGAIYEHSSTLDGVMPNVGIPPAGRVIH